MGNDERTGVLAGGDRAVNEPAQRVLLIGPILNNAQKAMQGSTKVLTAASKAFAEFEPEPEFVDRARVEWNILLPELPRRDLMQNVTFKLLSQHPSEDTRNSGLHGWTNSKTEIYLADPLEHRGHLDENVWWRTILYHEALHIKQFAEHGGAPKTYTQMIEYEIEAYRKTTDWLFDTDHPQQYPSEQMVDARIGLQNIKLDFIEIRSDAKDDSTEEREKKYKNVLVDKSLLPSHENIEELYGR